MAAGFSSGGRDAKAGCGIRPKWWYRGAAIFIVVTTQRNLSVRAKSRPVRVVPLLAGTRPVLAGFAQAQGLARMTDDGGRSSYSAPSERLGAATKPGQISSPGICCRSAAECRDGCSLAQEFGHLATAMLPSPHAEFQFLSKQDLHQLANGLLAPEPWVVERCIDFVLAETRGMWHGRARAKMCRRLKHCDLGRTNRTRLVDGILDRLREGRFSEQFKDQLRLALQLDCARTLKVCAAAIASDKAHIARYGAWVIGVRSSAARESASLPAVSRTGT